jgi:hypothetical protein
MIRFGVILLPEDRYGAAHRGLADGDRAGL